MDEFWQLLLVAMPGIITGAVVPLILQWKSKRAEAKKLEADYKVIEDDITERVLKRAREEINGLTSENKVLKKDLDDVKEEKKALADRVEHLENRCVVMQGEYDRLEALFNELKERFVQVCNQLRNAGIEPEISIEDLNGRD